MPLLQLYLNYHLLEQQVTKNKIHVQVKNLPFFSSTLRMHVYYNQLVTTLLFKNSSDLTALSSHTDEAFI